MMLEKSYGEVTSGPLTYKGISLSTRAWAKKLNIPHMTLVGRLKRGWTVGESLGFDKRKIPLPQKQPRQEQEALGFDSVPQEPIEARKPEEPVDQPEPEEPEEPPQPNNHPLQDALIQAVRETDMLLTENATLRKERDAAINALHSIVEAVKVSIVNNR